MLVRVFVAVEVLMENLEEPCSTGRGEIHEFFTHRHRYSLLIFMTRRSIYNVLHTPTYLRTLYLVPARFARSHSNRCETWSHGVQ